MKLVSKLRPCQILPKLAKGKAVFSILSRYKSTCFYKWTNGHFGRVFFNMLTWFTVWDAPRSPTRPPGWHSFKSRKTRLPGLRSSICFYPMVHLNTSTQLAVYWDGFQKSFVFLEGGCKLVHGRGLSTQLRPVSWARKRRDLLLEISTCLI